jgi:hypothetical protein
MGHRRRSIRNLHHRPISQYPSSNPTEFIRHLSSSMLRSMHVLRPKLVFEKMHMGGDRDMCPFWRYRGWNYPRYSSNLSCLTELILDSH